MSQPSNFEKWRALTDGLPSPDLFIDWSFYFMIGAALERRVWYPPAHDPIFANKYVITTGKTGVGKGGPIKLVSSILRDIKRESIKRDLSKLSDSDRALAQTILDNDDSRADKQHNEGLSKNGVQEKALLFPRAPNSTTLPSLTQGLAQAYRFIPYLHKKEDGTTVSRNYGHCSMYACLEELASLFRDKSHDLVNFLLQTYDCIDVYEAHTKTQGKDRILKVCFNMLAGTTPAFMQDTFEAKIVEEGFARRTLFIYAEKDRKTVFTRPELTPEQLQYGLEIAQHVKQLATLYGQVEVDEETKQFLWGWFDDIKRNPGNRVCRQSKLDPYYSTANLHVVKTAMALHFSETTSMAIPLATFKKAIEVNAAAEKTMHLGLLVGEKNPLAKIGRKVVSLLNLQGKKRFEEIWAVMFEETGGTRQGLEEVLEFLDATNQIVSFKEDCDKSGQPRVYYKTKQ